MTERNSCVHRDEQYRLINECRHSGMTDHQWCVEHNIKPGTFYNWVKRLKRLGSYDIPSPYNRVMNKNIPDIVPLFVSDEPQKKETGYIATTASYTIEISQGQSTIRINNAIDPELLTCILRNL